MLCPSCCFWAYRLFAVALCMQWKGLCSLFFVFERSKICAWNCCNAPGGFGTTLQSATHSGLYLIFTIEVNNLVPPYKNTLGGRIMEWSCSSLCPLWSHKYRRNGNRNFRFCGNVSHPSCWFTSHSAFNNITQKSIVSLLNGTLTNLIVMWKCEIFYYQDILQSMISKCEVRWKMMLLGCGVPKVMNISRVVFVGGSRRTSSSLDLTFPPTGLSENFPARERVIPRNCWNSAELQQLSVNVVQRFKTDSV